MQQLQPAAGHSAEGSPLQPLPAYSFDRAAAGSSPVGPDLATRAYPAGASGSWHPAALDNLGALALSGSPGAAHSLGAQKEFFELEVATPSAAGRRLFDSPAAAAPGGGLGGMGSARAALEARRLSWTDWSSGADATAAPLRFAEAASGVQAAAQQATTLPWVERPPPSEAAAESRRLHATDSWSDWAAGGADLQPDSLLAEHAVAQVSAAQPRQLSASLLDM